MGRKTDIIDDFEPGAASPALAMIGYVKALTTYDMASAKDFESTFGKDYMGFGGAMVAVSALGRIAADPEVYLLQFASAYYRRPIRKQNRAARTFLFDVLDMYEASELRDEDGDIDFPDPADEDTTTASVMMPLVLSHSKFGRVPYIQGVGWSVATLVVSLAADAGVDEQKILAELHHAYLDGGLRA